MFKENGRKTPADKFELAGLKGKHMRCPNCGEYETLVGVQFASTQCKRCGTEMMDASSEFTGKASGK